MVSQKYPNVNLEFYCFRRNCYVHMGIEKILLSFSDHNKIIEDIEKLWELRKQDDDFKFVKPRLVQTVKWKFHYIIFRKTVCLV